VAALPMLPPTVVARGAYGMLADVERGQGWVGREGAARSAVRRACGVAVGARRRRESNTTRRARYKQLNSIWGAV
jgi:hypothetical protein